MITAHRPFMHGMYENEVCNSTVYKSAQSFMIAEKNFSSGNTEPFVLPTRSYSGGCRCRLSQNTVWHAYCPS